MECGNIKFLHPYRQQDYFKSGKTKVVIERFSALKVKLFPDALAEGSSSQFNVAFV